MLFMPDARPPDNSRAIGFIATSRHRVLECRATIRLLPDLATIDAFLKLGRGLNKK